MKTLITPEDATRIIMGTVHDFGIEHIPLASAIGRTLREEILADRPLPPFDRVAMDGIAIRYEAFAQGQKTFAISGTQPAGKPPLKPESPKHCIEIMTGAMLGEGVDTVIRYEDLEISNGKATIVADNIREGQNIHYCGEDAEAGRILLRPGKRLGSPEIAISSSVGKRTLAVAKLPRIGIFSSGDELVPTEATPLPHQIRSSNAESLGAALDQRGLTARRHHLADNQEAIRRILSEVIEYKDVLILSGGISKGKYDYIGETLESLGAPPLFHGVAQKPGKPFWFGWHEKHSTAIFALPGNPVSGSLCFHRYVMPWLVASLREEPALKVSASLTHQVVFKPDLTYFPAVKLTTHADGRLQATVCEGHGSGDFVQLGEADGFLELPAEKQAFNPGSAYPFHPIRNLLL